MNTDVIYGGAIVNTEQDMKSIPFYCMFKKSWPSYYIKWVKASWTYGGTIYILKENGDKDHTIPYPVFLIGSLETYKVYHLF